MTFSNFAPLTTKRGGLASLLIRWQCHRFYSGWRHERLSPYLSWFKFDTSRSDKLPICDFKRHAWQGGKTNTQRNSTWKYVITNTKPSIISVLGAIPKPNSDKIQLIHDCSRLEHSNVNSYATTQHFSYMTLDKAVSLIKPNVYLAKIDLKSAYRRVPIHPSNYTAAGLVWQFGGENQITYMYDCKLPFGALKSPEIFQRLTQAITRIMTKRGFWTVIAYLDDFLIVGDSEREGKIVYNELIRLLNELVFQINQNKAVPPTQRLTFLGIEIDTVDRQLLLPNTKLSKLRELLNISMAKRSLTKRELQSLIGKLNFVARVVFGGRTFLRHMIDTVNSLRCPHHIRPIVALKADLSWWAEFFSGQNSICVFLSSKL